MSKTGVTREIFEKVIKSQTAKRPVFKEQIAATLTISPSTVDAIRHAGTWDEWERRKAAKSGRVKASRSSTYKGKPVPKSVEKVAKAQAAKKLEKLVKGKSARPELVTAKPVAKPVKKIAKRVNRQKTTDQWSKELFAMFEESKKTIADLRGEIADIRGIALDARAISKSTDQRVRPLIEKHNRSITDEAIALSQRFRSPFKRFGRRG